MVAATRSAVLAICLATYFVSISMLYQMSPFFQLYAEQETGCSASSVGLIFAALPFFSFLGALPSGHMVNRLGARESLLGGLLLLATSTLFFGLSRSVHGWLFWRAVQGLSTAPVYTAISSTLAKTFTGPGEFSRVNGLQEVVANIAFTVGPLMGGFLFQFGGFFLPFAVSAAVHVVLVTLSCVVAASSNAQAGAAAAAEKEAAAAENGGELAAPLLDAAEEEDDGSSEEQHLTVYSICHRKVVCIAGVSVIVNVIWGGMEPALAGHFRESLGDIPNSYIGMLIAVPSITGTLVTMTVPMLSERLPDTYILVGGFALFVVALGCFAAPDAPSFLVVGGLVTGSPGQWALQLTALLVAGAAFTLSWTPVLPSMMDEAAEKVAALRHIEAGEEAVHAVSAPVASLFNAAMGIGEAMGPVLGGMLINVCGFAGMSVVFIVLVSGYGAVLLLEHFGSIEAESPDEPPHDHKATHYAAVISRQTTPVPQLHLRAASRCPDEREPNSARSHGSRKGSLVGVSKTGTTSPGLGPAPFPAGLVPPLGTVPL